MPDPEHLLHAMTGLEANVSKSRPTIVKEGEEFHFHEQDGGIWSCPFCEPVKRLFTSTDAVKEHIHTEHSKKQVSHNGLVIFKCNQDCGVLRERSHYHCPTCDKAVISRGDFIFHLKGHDVKRGVRAPRGRKKTLATVMNDEAGVEHIQLFSHASLVVSPTILSLIEDQKKFWSDLEIKSGMTCLRDEGQQFCVLQGQYDSVLKANTFLERYVLDKLHNEISAQLQRDSLDILVQDAQRTEAQQDESQNSTNQEVLANDEGQSEIRKSGRKRKPNTLLDQYVTPKSAKIEPGASEASNSAAIRQSSVAQTLKTTVEQECHVTLSKNMQSGEYQVHLMFPPPIITQPAAIEPATLQGDGSRPDPSTDPLDDGNNPLAEIDDDDADEDYAVDPEIENAASEEEMDPEADEIDKLDDATEKDSTPSSMLLAFRCNQCELEFSSINLLMKHKRSNHDDHSRSTQSGDREPSDSLHSCKECSYSTTLKQNLKLHISRTHKEKQLSCLDCGEKFGPLIDLKTHIRNTGHRQGKHTNLYKQMVECKVCGKKLQLKNLKSHTELVHEKVKPFSCEICGKMFGTRFLVKEHMESHKNLQDRERPWKCNICGQAFFKKLPLDEHMAKHIGVPAYQCDKCPKKFYHQSGWKRHLQHHGEERPFTCATCGKSFKTSTNLSAHKTVHTPTAFMCLCGKSYQQKHTLKYHQDKCPMHQDILANQLVEEQYNAATRYMCGFCQETFADFDVVQEHVKQHIPVTDTIQVESSFEGALTLTDQQAEQQTLAEIEGSGLEHLAMTAALEQQNMMTEGRTLLVTDIGPEQIQLMAYQNTTMVDTNGQVLEQSQAQLIDQQGRAIEGGQVVEQAGQQIEGAVVDQTTAQQLLGDGQTELIIEQSRQDPEGSVVRVVESAGQAMTEVVQVVTHPADLEDSHEPIAETPQLSIAQAENNAPLSSQELNNIT